MDNLPEFLAEIDQMERELPKVHRDTQVELLIAAYEDLIQRSPVLTGAYRAEHLLTEGESFAIRYEAPNRAGPDEPARIDGGVLEPPNVGDAKLAIEAVAPFSLLSAINQRFYAPFLEYGTATMTPRLIYQSAEDRLASLIQTAQLDEGRLQPRR